MTDNRPLPLTGEDWFRHTATRIDRLERRTGNMLTPDLLGPGIASMAVAIIDWNALEVTFNGFFYSNAGIAINSPDPEIPWTGQTIAKDDGSGMQQVWSTGTLEPIYWVRNYAPNPEPGGQPVFGPWQRFASEGGTIPTEVLAFSWEDGDAYTLTAGDVASGVFQFGLTYYPHLESVHAAWGGVIQHPDEYAMNYSTATVTWPLTGFEEAGDVFWFHYTHDKRLRPPDPPCEPLAGLVIRGVESYEGPFTEIALPAGTEAGDLVVVVAHGPNDGGSNYPPPGAGAMTDARMDGHYPHPTGDDWWGTATSLADVELTIVTGGSAIIATFGDTGGNSPLTVSQVVSVTKADVLGNPGDPIDVVSIDAAGVVALTTYDHGSGSDNPIELDGFTHTYPSPDYTQRCGGVDWWTGTGGSPASTWTVVSGYQRYDRTVTLLAVGIEGCEEEPPIEPPPEPLDGLLCADGPYDGGATEPTFVGTAGAVLADASDATWLVWSDPTSYFNYGLEVLPPDLDPEAYSLEIRMMSNAVDAVDPAVVTMEVFISTDALGADEIAGFSDGAVSGYGFTIPSTVLTGGVPVDVSVPLSLGAWSPTTLADVTAALEAGAYLAFNSLNWVDGDTPPAIRIYSACINYTGPAPEEPPPDPVGDGPYVTPLSAKAVHEGYGICQHVNFQSDNIHAGATNQAAILDRYGSMHAHQMRSMYNPNTSAAFLAAIDGCRDHGVKWNALVAARQDNGTISPSEATIRSRITKMATDHADVIGWIEGINEPNEPSDPNWVDDVLYAQWVIWDEWSQHPELAHVKILSPSMHDTRLDASDGAHWDMYANGEITVGGETYTGKDLCHMAAVHSYPAGNLPDTNRADRVQWVYDAFGAGFPIKFTEWGYTNALGEPRIGGHKVANEASAAAYSAQAILDFANNEWELLQYEMMDDPNSANNDTEKNFGQYRVESNTGAPNTTWTAKPSVAAITAVLSALEDPGSDYLTGDVTLDLSDVPSGVRTCVTQKRDGTTTLWLWRHQAMWNAVTETPITVGTVSVPVTDIAGLRNITVGVAPVAVNVRLVP